MRSLELTRQDVGRNRKPVVRLRRDPELPATPADAPLFQIV
jgi:hypothetical protein